MPLRVIQWGAGLNGQALIRAITGHADLQLVGCRVWSDAKHGVDAGTLAGIPPLGVPATTDRDAIMALDADVVIFCPRLRPDMTESDADLIDLLRSGKNVISVSGAHSMPSTLPDGRGARIKAACIEGGSTMAAAGVNPGFIAERLAPTLSGMCMDVSRITVQETYLCDKGNPDILFDTMGFGRDPDDWTAQSATGAMFDGLFSQLVHNVARSMGVELERVAWQTQVSPAPRDITLPAGVVPQGTVAAITQRWEGIPTDPDQVKIVKQTRWVCADDLPGYDVKSGWQITIEGIPNVVAEVRLDSVSEEIHQPEAMVGSAIGVIREVIAAPPGILLPNIYAPFRKRFH